MTQKDETQNRLKICSQYREVIFIQSLKTASPGKHTIQASGASSLAFGVTCC
jgi:hypothetical protein